MPVTLTHCLILLFCSPQDTSTPRPQAQTEAGPVVAGAAEVTKSMILATWQRAWSSVASLKATWRIEQGGPEYPPGHYLHGETTWHAPDHVGLDFAHGADGLAWQSDYWRNRSFIRGRTYQVHWPNKLAFEQRELAEHELPDRLATQPWFRATGYWPESAARAPNLMGISVSLADALRSDSFTLKTARESLNGTSTVVLEWLGRSRIHLDPARSYAILARSWQDADGAMSVELEVEQWVTLNELLSAPSRILVRSRELSTNAPPPTSYRVEVTSVTVDSLTLADFTYEPQPGALRMRRGVDEEFSQAVPGGREFLLRTAEHLRRDFADTARTDRPILVAAAATLFLWTCLWFWPKAGRSVASLNP